ncbi:hypothetical protein F2P56_027384 [Juglans regia]|uniref:Uncharacterized protein n=1 Tax=Juglans regia TaxID=51240 RepID=A0A833X8X5_JUGRE|nr:hypothetical protein F2P56_027384 [Juglans regia]
MGCGESKVLLEVAAANTIISHKPSEHDPDSKMSKDIETIPEANTTDNTTNSSLQQQLEAENEDNNDDLGGAEVAADAKKIDETTVEKEGDDEKKIDNGTVAKKEADKENEAVKVVGESVIKEAESEKTVEKKNQNADNQEKHTADT